MNKRTSILLGTFLAGAALATWGACGSTYPNGTGGSNNGGAKPTGGSNTGGSSTGGSSTGGSSSGGSSTGGASTGGAKTGGAGGGSSTGGTGTGGASDAKPATFATVKEAIEGLCAGADCHAANEHPPAMAGLKDDTKLYNTLTSFKSTRCGNRTLVKAGSPAESAFYLAQAGAPNSSAMCGTGFTIMPKGCTEDTCTPSNYLDAIKAWIQAGAPK